MAALDVAIGAMIRDGAMAEAAHLRTMRDVVTRLFPTIGPFASKPIMKLSSKPWGWSCVQVRAR